MLVSFCLPHALLAVCIPPTDLLTDIMILRIESLSVIDEYCTAKSAPVSRSCSARAPAQDPVSPSDR